MDEAILEIHSINTQDTKQQERYLHIIHSNMQNANKKDYAQRTKGKEHVKKYLFDNVEKSKSLQRKRMKKLVKISKFLCRS